MRTLLGRQPYLPQRVNSFVKLGWKACMGTRRAAERAKISGFRSALAMRVEIAGCIASQQKFIAESRDKPELAFNQEKVLALLREALEAQEDVLKLCDVLTKRHTRFAEPTNITTVRKSGSAE